MIVALFSLPFVWVLRSSLMEMSQIFQLPPHWVPRPLAWQNYLKAVTVIPFGRYFLNTLLVVATTLLGSVLTCSLGAFSFSRLRWRGRDLIFVILLTSLMMPYAVTLIPTFVLWKYLRGINTFLPLIVPSWFGTGVGGVFNIFLLRQFFLTLPFELDEAAYMDGAAPLAVYWFVVMPLSTPVLVAVIVLTFGWAWNDLLSPLVYLIDSNKFTLAIGLAEIQQRLLYSMGSAYGCFNNRHRASFCSFFCPPKILYPRDSSHGTERIGIERAHRLPDRRSERLPGFRPC